ncbi:MAG: M4 family metallopeptidase [Saprospiraceae bacterium]
MKYTFTFFFTFLFICATNAQFKSPAFGNNQKAKDNTIIVPNGKLNKPSTFTTPFNPSSLQYIDNTENGLEVISRSEDQLPILITGTPAFQMRSIATVEDKAYNFLENAKGLMKINNPQDEFELLDTQIDDIGMTHIKLQQMYNGIPVYGAEIIYHQTEKTQFVNGRYKATPASISTIPSLSILDSEMRVTSDIGAIKEIESDKYGLFNFEKINTDLVVYYNNDVATLAYHTTIYKNIINRWEYFIDAQTGAVLSKHSSICKFHNHDIKTDTKDSNTHSCTHSNHSASISTSHMPPPDGPVVSNAQDLFGNNISINTYQVGSKYYLIDAAKNMYDQANSDMPDDPVGAVWTIDAFNTSPQNSNFEYDHVSSSNSNFSGENTGVSAQYNGGQAYKYFETIHNRQSINGEGGNVIGLINISDEDGSSLGNAFWNGVAMFYGNGSSKFKPLARGLDVAGHEMSHGVIQSTANLAYMGESGALNESFADIFGAMIDRDDWLIGEDVVKPSFPSGALRSIIDPHNGASTGDYGNGWQPRIYSERFTGSQDNGGVHINSGITNWAFYKFATANGVGKNKAEKVYYRALTKYLTKSSQFIDARIAVVQASKDLYGDAVADAAKSAFDAVQIFDGNSTTNQTDVDVNPGTDLILFTTKDQNNLYVADGNGTLIFDPLTDQKPKSVPSITDDGSEILFVNEAGDLYYIRIDWSNTTIVEEGVITSNDKYRNAVFSRDGLRMAALRDVQDNMVFVYDFESSSGNDYELFNPTFTEGVSTGDVIYADAMEFDYAGEYLMYDAFNRLQGQQGNIEYWDIGFIKVYDKNNATFTLGNDIQKLFSQLPEGISIGNPTFSKNSEYIIAFDFIEDGKFEVKGANIETGEVKDIFPNNSKPGYPSFSNNDNKIIFDANDNNDFGVIASTQLKDNKIEAVPSTAVIQLGFESVEVKWGVWFGNGERDITDVDDVLSDNVFTVFPNPAHQQITVRQNLKDNENVSITIVDLMGRMVYNRAYKSMDISTVIDISPLTSGQYILNIKSNEGTGSQIFIKE